MYMFKDMIDMGLQGSEWTSDDHMVVAVNACIGNLSVKTMDDLSNNVKVINQIPQDEIRLVTGMDLILKGCYLTVP